MTSRSCSRSSVRIVVDGIAVAARAKTVWLYYGREGVVEVDGGIHSARRSRDERRDRNLARLGYRVVRVSAELVRCNIAEAVARIAAALRAVG